MGPWKGPYAGPLQAIFEPLGLGALQVPMQVLGRWGGATPPPRPPRHQRLRRRCQGPRPYKAFKRKTRTLFPFLGTKECKRGGVFQGMFSPRMPEKPYRALKILRSLGSEVFHL